jgi:hypothetical protein
MKKSNDPAKILKTIDRSLELEKNYRKWVAMNRDPGRIRKSMIEREIGRLT